MCTMLKSITTGDKYILNHDYYVILNHDYYVILNHDYYVIIMLTFLLLLYQLYHCQFEDEYDFLSDMYYTVD